MMRDITIDIVPTIGAVSFVGMLLIISGIEQNPGPKDKFIFRYQFLLIEIGTGVLRTLFDILVSNDFMKYLNDNPTQQTQLQFLMNRDIITDDQKKFLPPLDTKPNSANFDVTLLACLLRNVCGLRGPKHPVWNNPPSTDLSIEADIVRLRDCRNNLQHSGTVFVDETDLSNKWIELRTILIRLNNTCKIAALPKQITDAETMDVDKELKKRHDEIIKLWSEMDRSTDHGIGELVTKVDELELGQTELKIGLSDLKSGQAKLQTGHSELKSGQAKLQTGQTELKSGQAKLQTGQTELKSGQAKLQTGQTELKGEMVEIKKCLDKMDSVGASGGDNVDPETDIKQRLIETYHRDCCTLPLSPLYQEEEDDFFKVYQTPTMHQVDYHSSERTQENKNISAYKDIFVTGEQSFQNIYVTGDAGVGKTSLCKCLCLLWCKSQTGGVTGDAGVGKTSLCKCLSLLWCKSQTGGTIDNPDIHSDINFLNKFEFLFYISLRDTECRDVVSMIVDQFFDSESKVLHEKIEHVLRNHKCLIILDAYDEWSPKVRGKKECKIPLRVHSENVVYLTTCRPYKIENVRLSRREIDQHVCMSGIHGESSKSFIEEVVKHMNKENKVNKNVNDFMREVEECGIGEQLCIPIIASHLVVVWFAQKLTDMSKAALYGKIVELLFVRAKQSNVTSPASPMSEFQLPALLSKLRYLKEHVFLLQKVCLLSFGSLFKQDDDVLSLVFTSQQLRSEPYLLCDDEMEFLCKIGIMSKNKVIGCFEERKQKLSFLHKSYMEFLAALFVTSFDTDHEFDKVVGEWTLVNDVTQFQSFLSLLAGFSYHRVKCLFDNIYLTISDDLALCRQNAIFHYDYHTYMKQINLLQLTVIHCWKECGRSNDPNNAIQLQDFSFDGESNVEALNQLLLLNTSVIKSLHSGNGNFNVNFGHIKNLQCLNIGRIIPGDYTNFTKCMLQNQASLHSVSIKGDYKTKPLLSDLPVRNLPHLTSFSLTGIKMEHNNLHHLVTYLSNNILLQNIDFDIVQCNNHEKEDEDCTMMLDLSHHSHLTSLYLIHVNILCSDVNITCLKSIILMPLSERIGSCYNNVLHCIENSQLECLIIDGDIKLDYRTINTLISTIETLSDIKFLALLHMCLPDDVSLHIHPHVIQVKVRLLDVTWSCRTFQSFVESVVNVKSVKYVYLYKCKILSGAGQSRREMSVNESIDYMFKHLIQQPTVNITFKGIYKDKYRNGETIAFNTSSE